MHLCFVDESGTPAKPGRDKPRYFVIAGVVIPEERWQILSKGLRGLKIQFGYRGEVKWRYFAPANSDYANPMLDWPQQRRDDFRAKLFRILTAQKSVRLIAAVCEAAPAYQLGIVNEQSDIYFQTYKVITERFQYFLQDVTRESGHTTLGMIVADHRGRGDDEQLRLQHQRLIDTEQQYTSTYTNFVESLFFAPSHMSVGVQYADLVAGATWRLFEAEDDRWFQHVSSAFRRSRNGRLDGYGICRFPKHGWQGRIVN